MTGVEQLFDEYAVRFRRGERPDLREYLRRAGDGADELAALVDVFLQAAPAPEPDEEALARARALVEGEPALLAARNRRGITRAQVVDALIERLGLDEAKRDQVRRRYHELETGQLEPKRVDARIWEALAPVLETAVADLRSWRPSLPPAPSAASAYYRAEAEAQVAARLRERPPEEPDEIDRLFGVE